MRSHRLFLAGVGLAAFATIAFELLLTRILSVTLYYHFAFLVVSIAMLGLSISGVSISLFPRAFAPSRAPLLASLFMLLFAVCAPWALRTALATPLSLVRWQDDLGKLAWLYATAGLTLLASGFAISLAIASAKEHIGPVYACDLIGAALGCVFVVPALSWLGGPGAVVMGAAAGALSAGCFAASAWRSGAAGRRASIAGVLVACGIAAPLLAGLALAETRAHRFGLARNPEKFLQNRQVLFEKWNSFSQVTVTPGSTKSHWIFIDADAATRLWKGGVKEGGGLAPRVWGEVRVASLAYTLRHDRPALIIGPGGGTDVISALTHGVPRVVAVEVNPIIVDDIVRGRFAAFAGDLYRDPRVQVIVDEGRSHVRRSGAEFGIIQATLVDTWAASSSGAFALSENTLYTVEAFEEFLAHLVPGGILTVTRWYDPTGPKEFLRLVALGRAALERRGVAPGDVHKHFILAHDTSWHGTLLLGRDPFTAADARQVASQAMQDGLEILFDPTVRSPHQDTLLANFLRAPDGAAFLDALPFDASPTTDDRPFFFYNLRGGVLALARQFRSVAAANLGPAILLALFGLSAALTVALVVGPLLVWERGSLATGRRRKLRVLGYFLCLGLGFILIEIGLMQKFVLFLGHPLYALVVVLASLLASSGAGSALSGRAAARSGAAGHARRAILVLAAILVIYAFALTPVFHALLTLPLGARIVLSVALVIVPGAIMGTLLPSGVRIAGGLGDGVVAWGWGLNGAASVLGSILAVGLSMSHGFTVELLVGVLVYLIAWAALPRP